MSVIYNRPWSSPLMPHAVAVRVTPAVAIVSSSIAAATLITTLIPHGLASGDTVAIAGHAGSTPAVDGAYVATVVSPLMFTVPLAVTIAGTGGTVTRTLAVEPLTLVQGKLRAGLDWADGDARDVLMAGFIAAARGRVEQDTGIALLATTYDVHFDALPSGPVALPRRPVPSVISVTAIDTAGAVTTLAAATYELDPSSVAPMPARLARSAGSVWPTDLRTFQPWTVRIIAGFPSVPLLQAAAPELVHAVGLLTAHYATLGRDLLQIGHSVDTTPYGYEDAIAAYQLVTLA